MSSKSELRKNLEKRKREIISHNKSIIQKANEVLTGKIDPFDVKIEEEILTLKKIREIVDDEDDLKRGLTGYESINDINSKQQEKLTSIISEKSDPRWQLKNKQITDFLNNKSRFDEFKDNFIIPLLNQGKENSKIAIPIKQNYPKILHENFFKDNEDLLNEIFHSLETELSKVDNIFKIQSSKLKEPAVEIQEENEFYDQIMEIFDNLKQNNEIKLLKFILSTNYMETLMRLQAISYLVSNGFIELKPSSKEEIEESGNYKIVFSKDNKSKIKGNDFNSTVILGISFDEWKSLQPFIKKGSLKNRPHLMNLG